MNDKGKAERMGKEILTKIRYALSRFFSAQWAIRLQQQRRPHHWSASDGGDTSLEPKLPLARQRELQHCLAAPSAGGPFRGKQLARADIAWLLAVYSKDKGMHGLSEHPEVTRREGPFLDLREADLHEVDLRGLALSNSDFTGAHLQKAHLEGCVLHRACLVTTDLREAHLEGAILAHTALGGANLQGAYFDGSTILADAALCDDQGHCAALADVRWGGVYLATIDWVQVPWVGDEEAIDHQRHAGAYRTALRAYRQLASVLRDQGLFEEADQFAFQAQALKRSVRAWTLIHDLRRRPSSRFSLHTILRQRRFIQTDPGLVTLASCTLAPFLATLAVHTGVPALLQASVFLLSLLLMGWGLGVLLLPVLLQVVAAMVVQVVAIFIALAAVLSLLYLILGVTLYPLIVRLSTLPLGPLALMLFVLLAGFLVFSRLVVRRSKRIMRGLSNLGTGIETFNLSYWDLIKILALTSIGCASLAFSQFLNYISGYGYKPERCFLWYVLAICSFTVLYSVAGQPPGLDTFLLSITAFHGRGFFPGSFPHPNLFLETLAASEAVLGLFIELSFVAAFTQRYYGK